MFQLKYLWYLSVYLIRNYVVFGARIEVSFGPWNRWNHTLEIRLN